MFRRVPQLALSTQLSAYHQLLSATIDFLQQQKSRGQRHVVVDQSKLLALASPNPGKPTGTKDNLPASVGPMVSTKADSFVDLRQMVLSCTQCPNLVSSRKNVVFGVGNESADLLFVGEAPGADEDEQGEPFVGKAGQLLTKIIETMGLKREDVYIANILK